MIANEDEPDESARNKERSTRIELEWYLLPTTFLADLPSYTLVRHGSDRYFKNSERSGGWHAMPSWPGEIRSSFPAGAPSRGVQCRYMRPHCCSETNNCNDRIGSACPVSCQKRHDFISATRSLRFLVVAILTASTAADISTPLLSSGVSGCQGYNCGAELWECMLLQANPAFPAYIFPSSPRGRRLQNTSAKLLPFSLFGASPRSYPHSSKDSLAVTGLGFLKGLAANSVMLISDGSDGLQVPDAGLWGAMHTVYAAVSTPEAQKWRCKNVPSGKEGFPSRTTDLGKNRQVTWETPMEVGLTIYVLLDALVRQHTGAVAVDLITNRHIVAQHGHVLQPCPPAYRAVPADDRALDPRVLLHLRALQQHTPLQPHTVANDHIRSDRDVRADLAVLANGRRGVDHDIAAVDADRRPSRSPRGQVGRSSMRFSTEGLRMLVHNDTVFARLLHLGDHNGTLVTVVLVEFCEVSEGVVADDIAVQDEERRVVLAQDLLSQLERACSAQWLVDGKNDVGDAGSSKSLDLVQDHGPVAEFNERLREGEGQWAQTAIADQLLQPVPSVTSYGWMGGVVVVVVKKVAGAMGVAKGNGLAVEYKTSGCDDCEDVVMQRSTTGRGKIGGTFRRQPTCPTAACLLDLSRSGPTHTLARLPRPSRQRPTLLGLSGPTNPCCDANPRLVWLPASVLPVLDGAIRAALWGRDHSCIEPSILIDTVPSIHTLACDGRRPVVTIKQRLQRWSDLGAIHLLYRIQGSSPRTDFRNNRPLIKRRREKERKEKKRKEKKRKEKKRKEKKKPSSILQNVARLPLGTLLGKLLGSSSHFVRMRHRKPFCRRHKRIRGPIECMVQRRKLNSTNLLRCNFHNLNRFGGECALPFRLAPLDRRNNDYHHIPLITPRDQPPHPRKRLISILPRILPSHLHTRTPHRLTLTFEIIIPLPTMLLLGRMLLLLLLDLQTLGPILSATTPRMPAIPRMRAPRDMVRVPGLLVLVRGAVDIHVRARAVRVPRVRFPDSVLFVVAVAVVGEVARCATVVASSLFGSCIWVELGWMGFLSWKKEERRLRLEYLVPPSAHLANRTVREPRSPAPSWRPEKAIPSPPSPRKLPAPRTLVGRLV
ncbi:hypothetical protein KC361_g299 [Hortaea werneckii]|nr:hypothetical protein KC361_g299 [Hortaea werneckii]